MTKLECNVTNCLHNADNCCCKQSIMVDGHDAKKKEQTCCGSFDENKGGLFKNVFKTPESSLSVDCEAVQKKSVRKSLRQSSAFTMTTATARLQRLALPETEQAGQSRLCVLHSRCPEKADKMLRAMNIRSEISVCGSGRKM